VMYVTCKKLVTKFHKMQALSRFLGTDAVLREHMTKRDPGGRGTIVNISSITGKSRRCSNLLLLS
jgi:NAD(P)-dependent dehydrogenase (short-subunit alcohol dehydrogenase family)